MPSPWLVELLKTLDSDDYRHEVRSAVLAGDAALVRSLVAEPEALEQPLRFAVALGNFEAVPPERRREILEKAVVAHPDDLAVLMALGGTYPHNRSGGAAERADPCRHGPRSAGEVSTVLPPPA